MRGDGWMEGGLQVGGEGLRERKEERPIDNQQGKTRDKTKSRCDKSRISIITLTSKRNKKQTDAESVRICVRRVAHIIRRN